jgi:urease accessory protein
MRRFTKLVPKSGTTAPVTNIPRLVLAFEARKKSRQLVKLDSGEEIGILLPPGTILREGDVVESEDGSQFEIQAATENLMMVTAPDPFLLLRAAYHLGNRHTAIEIRPDRLFLQVDPVLKEMLVGLRVTVSLVTEKFTPETGAYGGGHKHGHDETFEEDYAVAQRVFHEHHGKEEK